MATKLQKQHSFNDWARKFNVSTLWDSERFENREFLKKLDAARPVYDELKRNKRNGNI